MAEWKLSTFGSNETLGLGFFKIVVVYRNGTQSSPIPENERYEFVIGGLVSKKKFATLEEAKKAALSSAANHLTAALNTVKGMMQN
jgi:hypothetical protein